MNACMMHERSIGFCLFRRTIVLGSLHGNNQVQTQKDKRNGQPLCRRKGMSKGQDGHDNGQEFARRGDGRRHDGAKPGDAQKDKNLAQSDRRIQNEHGRDEGIFAL